MNEGNLIHLVRGGLCYMKLSGGGGEHYLKPENDVPYHVCSVSIARSLSDLSAISVPVTKLPLEVRS